MCKCTHVNAHTPPVCLFYRYCRVTAAFSPFYFYWHDLSFSASALPSLSSALSPFCSAPPHFSSALTAHSLYPPLLLSYLISPVLHSSLRGNPCHTVICHPQLLSRYDHLPCSLFFLRHFSRSDRRLNPNTLSTHRQLTVVLVCCCCCCHCSC